MAIGNRQLAIGNNLGDDDVQTFTTNKTTSVASVFVEPLPSRGFGAATRWLVAWPGNG
jgi:hypothetical protein